MQKDSLARFKSKGQLDHQPEGGYFGRVPKIAHDAYAQLLPSSAWEVYTQIVTKAWKSEDDFTARISQAELKARTGLDEKTIRKGLALLVQIGLIDEVGKAAQGRPKAYRWTQATELTTEMRRQQLEAARLQFRVAGKSPPDMPLYPSSATRETASTPLRLHQGKTPDLDRENFPPDQGKIPDLDRENFPPDQGKIPDLDRENFPVPLIERQERKESAETTTSPAREGQAVGVDVGKELLAALAAQRLFPDFCREFVATEPDPSMVRCVIAYFQAEKAAGRVYSPGVLRRLLGDPFGFGFSLDQRGWHAPAPPERARNSQRRSLRYQEERDGAKRG